MNKKNTLVFFGNERLATGLNTKTPTLRRLIGAGYNVKAVVTNFEQAVSRKSRELEIVQTAGEHGIEVIIPEKPTDIIAQLKKMKPEIAVLVAYGKIIPQSIIDIFPSGIINIHPSLLPLHRGPIPIESVILSGEQQTGFSIMQLTKGMDSGPIYKQKEVLLKGNESKQELADLLLEQSSELIIEILPDILSGNITPTEQDESTATYDSLISKDQGNIDWSKPASRIEREIRAYSGWPKSKTKFANTDTVITEAIVLNHSGEPGKLFIHEKQLAVFCGEKSLLIKTLVPAGKKPMDAESFLAGYKARLNL